MVLFVIVKILVKDSDGALKHQDCLEHCRYIEYKARIVGSGECPLLVSLHDL